MRSIRLRTFPSLAAVFLAVLAIGCGTAPNSNNSAASNTAIAPGSNKALETPAPSPVACDDEAIEKAITDAFSDPNSPVKPELKHLSYTSRGCTVALVGWVTTDTVWVAAVRTVSSIPTVEGVNTKLFFVGEANYPHRPSAPCTCAKGYKACGEICIPELDDCRAGICATFVATPTPKP